MIKPSHQTPEGPLPSISSVSSILPPVRPAAPPAPPPPPAASSPQALSSDHYGLESAFASLAAKRVRVREIQAAYSEIHQAAELMQGFLAQSNTDAALKQLAQIADAISANTDIISPAAAHHMVVNMLPWHLRLVGADILSRAAQIHAE